MADLKQLGGYRIDGLIGSGTFADVYRAWDISLELTVALKVLKPALLADEDAFRRFLTEARVAARLVHPRIAWVRAVGEVDGSCFIAMHYLDGESLKERLARSGALSWVETLQITAQVVEALEFAYQNGVTAHRDIKPANILLEKGKGAVLTDFGLVRALESASIGTRSGTLLGTPEYMPPEVWEGQTGGVAADQYALACVVMEMLTGEALFGGSTPPAVMRRHFMPTKLPQSWQTDVPEGLSQVLLRALAPEPEQRYADLGEFLAALQMLSPEEEARHKAVEERKRQAIEAATQEEARRKRQADEKAETIALGCAQSPTVSVPMPAAQHPVQPQPDNQTNSPPSDSSTEQSFSVHPLSSMTKEDVSTVVILCSILLGLFFFVVLLGGCMSTM